MIKIETTAEEASKVIDNMAEQGYSAIWHQQDGSMNVEFAFKGVVLQNCKITIADEGTDTERGYVEFYPS